MIRRNTSMVLAFLTVLTACGGGGSGSGGIGVGVGVGSADNTPAPPTRAPQTPLASCDEVTSAVAAMDLGANIKARVLSTEAVPKANTVPAHCHVVGAVNERVGAIDGKPYAIKFRLRMPVDWNGRFFMEGGGGSNGVLGTAFGNLQGSQSDTALMSGFVVVATDSGHDNSVNSDPAASGGSAFGLDPQARIDFGYNSYDVVARVGKAVVARYYGRRPDTSYFVGCSEGGREAAMMAQRFPDNFDGVVVGDPGISLPYSASYAPYLVKSFGPLAVTQGNVDASGSPLINKTFTDGDLQIVSKAVVAACDKLDGVEDGMSQNLKACTDEVVMPVLKTFQCAGSKNDACLTSGQIDAFHMAMAGPKTSSGRQLYSATPWDPGIGGMNGATFNGGFRSWWLGTYASPTNNAIKITLSTPQHAMVWRTPPVPLTADRYVSFESNFDIDATEDLINATTSIYKESALSYGMANSTNLDAFRARGGKMLIYHGVADSSFSAYDTIEWHEGIRRRAGGTATDFAKLYLVPGMNHCSGGPGADKFNMVQPLVDWVEHGVAPMTIAASVSNPGYFGVAARTRPLCPYPTWAKYKGSGDVNLADSFVCSAE